MEEDDACRNAWSQTSNHILLAQLSRYGIGEETVREFEISYDARGGADGRVIIPLHDPDGSRIGYASIMNGRPLSDRFRFVSEIGSLKGAPS